MGVEITLKEVISCVEAAYFKAEEALACAHRHTRSRKLKQAVDRLVADVEQLASAWNGRHSMMEEGVDFVTCSGCESIGDTNALDQCPRCKSWFCYDCSYPPHNETQDVCNDCADEEMCDEQPR